MLVTHPTPPELQALRPREIQVGLNRIYLDDADILNYINVGEIDEACGYLSCMAMAKLDALVDGPVHYLVDLNRGGKLSPEARRLLREYSENRVQGKLALWGLHPVARMLAAFFFSATRKRDMRFFRSREAALAWLREDAEPAPIDPL